MSIICICSIFRDSATRRNDELTRYFGRLSTLDYPFEKLRFSFVEGDSKDNTYKRLEKWVSGRFGHNCVLEKYDTNTPYMGSVVHPVRFKTLADTANKTLDNAQYKWGNEIDWYFWVESDIIFSPSIIKELLKSAEELNTKFISPMIFLAPPDGRFYDIYAFIDFEKRKNFINDPPYHPDLEKSVPMRMYSVGSVMLMHRDVINAGVRWKSKRCIVDLCATAVDKGFEIWMDPRIKVWHPS